MEHNETTPMSAAEVAALLSQTMRDLAERKITLRQATTMANVAATLAKVLEVVDLNDRIELLEHVLKRKKTK